MGWFKNMIKKWLGIKPANAISLELKESMTFEQNFMRNKLWYLGDPNLLSQFYKNTSGDVTNSSRFWTVVPPHGQYIRKIHTGLPSQIINKLVEISTDILGVEANSDENYKRWQDIATENNFEELINEATATSLFGGDGAFKLIYNKEISEQPILSFVEGDKIEFSYNDYERMEEIIFLRFYENKNKQYLLKEKYGKGYIKYELYRDDKLVPLESIPQTAELEDILFDAKEIMALPLMFRKSKRYPKRGESIFEGKSDLFDSLDENMSQWVDALRAGRTKIYIPESLLPTDTKGNITLSPNPMHSYFAMGADTSNETAKNQITESQANIQADKYLATHISILDNCLQGIISPATIGIDVKKLDNAESQREKEKTTLYTRNKIVGTLSVSIPKLIRLTLMYDDLIKGKSQSEYIFKINFSEYANPSFEANIETMSKAAPGKQLISIEKIVDELWGTTLDEEEKKTEVERLRALNMPPQINNFLPGFDLSSGQGDEYDGSNE